MLRKLSVLLVIALLTVGIAQAQGPDHFGAEGLGDPYFPKAGNGGYDALHYTLDFTVDVEENYIEAIVTIDARTQKGLQRFNLDFSGFEIEAVLVNGVMEDYDRDGGELIVIPLYPIPADTDFTVTVVYSGVPDVASTEAIPIRLGWNNYGSGVYVASEPIGAQTWYPVNDHPLDKATYTFEITVDNPLVVAANGLLQETIDHGDGTSTYVWEASDPVASYLVTVNIDEFTMVSDETPDGLPIRNFFPTDIAEAAEIDFARTPEMIAFFSEIFGPYPFEAYGVVVSDTTFGFALETQTLSLFSRGSVTGDRANEEVVAHELAHQWFGDSVSLASWPDIWLNEGFATYASWLWMEHRVGPEAGQGYISRTYDFIANQASPGMIVPPGSAPRSDLFNVGVYVRGALVLHALRLHVGDDLFFEILQTYYARFANGNASTEDFIAVAEEVSEEDLGDFFDGWLYDETLPDIPEMGLKPDPKPATE